MWLEKSASKYPYWRLFHDMGCNVGVYYKFYFFFFFFLHSHEHTYEKHFNSNDFCLGLVFYSCCLSLSILLLSCIWLSIFFILLPCPPFLGHYVIWIVRDRFINHLQTKYAMKYCTVVVSRKLIVNGMKIEWKDMWGLNTVLWIRHNLRRKFFCFCSRINTEFQCSKWDIWIPEYFMED